MHARAKSTSSHLSLRMFPGRIAVLSASTTMGLRYERSSVRTARIRSSSPLERTLVRLIRSARSKTADQGRPWWESLAGKFKDDALFHEIVEAGRKYRKQTGRRAR